VPDSPFQYATLRVVPNLQRGEFVNAGVVVFCRQLQFLRARISFDEARLLALAPDVDPAPIREHLETLVRVADGDPAAGPIARMDQSERFHWLVAPSSTVVQPSPVHTGLCGDAEALLDRLFATLVLPSSELGWMRRSYELGELTEATLAPTWLDQFERWFAEARDKLEFVEANAMVLATSAPDARIVLLKGVDERGFVFYTDLSSAKGRQLEADPRAALVFGWQALERQVRVTGAAERLGDAESDAYFGSRPHGSQLSAASSRQSTVIASRGELEAARAELEARFPEGGVPRPERWGGMRIVPRTVEFWQGRENRLHDRLRFRCDDTGEWTVERLSP
jgi:pyridoxamine 5'-phosphate oxidase